MDDEKTIIFVLRHAHAASAGPGQRDYDRPLDERGRAEISAIRARMTASGLVPQRIVCSGAARTRQTYDGLGDLIAGVETEFSDRLYSGGWEDYLALLGGNDDGVPMLIGHNPAVVELVSRLAGDGDASAMRRLAKGFPKAGLAVLEFAGALGTIAPGSGFLRDLVAPER